MLSQNSSFYVTLPSNGRKKYFPNNSTNNYKNSLAREIRLDGDWEVAVTEVHYPQTIKSIEKLSKIQFIVYREDVYGTLKAKDPASTSNVDMKVIRIPLEYNLTDTVIAAPRLSDFICQSADNIVIELPVGRYTSPKDLGDYIASQLEIKLKALPDHTKSTNSKITFAFDNRQNKFTIKARLADLYYYKADDTSRLLGLEELKSSKYSAKRIAYEYVLPNPPKLNIVNSLYIYTDIVENDLVGDELVPLLRAVDVSGEHGAIIHEAFHRCYYKRVNRSNIPSIEIQLNTETGSEVKFETGHVISVLHFRKVTG